MSYVKLKMQNIQAQCDKSPGVGGALPHLAQIVGATIRKGWKVSRILSLKQCIQFHYLASFQGVLWGFVIVFLFWPTEVSAITLTKWR